MHFVESPQENCPKTKAISQKQNKTRQNWIPSSVASLTVCIMPPGSHLNVVHIYLNISKTLCDGLASLLEISSPHLIIAKWWEGLPVT